MSQDEDDFSSSRAVRKKRRLEISADEYQDDSDVEDYDGHGRAAQPDPAAGGADDDDMFSDGEPEAQQEHKPVGSKREVELLNIEEFEKENELSAEGSDSEADSEGPQQGAEDSGEVQMEPFNLQNEKKSGNFDKDGNFIAQRSAGDEEEEEEFWLKSLKKDEIARPPTKPKQAPKQAPTESAETLLTNLINLLSPVESPIEALQRLNKSRQSRADILKITEYCENLIELGFSDVYNLEKEELIVLFKQETGRAFKQAPNKYEFHWENDEQQVHGPYSKDEILYWKEHYFENKAFVRKVGDPEFVHVSEFQ